MSGVLQTLISAAIFALVVAAPFIWWWLQDRLRGKSTGDDKEPMREPEKDRFNHDDMFSDGHKETFDEQTGLWIRERD